MARKDCLSLQLKGTRVSGVEIIHFEPQQRPVSRRNIGIANGAVMIVPVPAMQLKNEASLRNEPLIIRAAVRALTAQQMLIPAAAGLDVTDANERLGTHGQRLNAKGQRLK